MNTLNQIWSEEEKIKKIKTHKQTHHHQNSEHYLIPNASHWA